MGNLLFSPNGRIGPQEFFKGMMILAVISAVITLTGLVSFQLSQILGLVSFLLLIPLFFLLIKRSHDAGKSGWMSIVWFILWIIIFVILGMLVNIIMPSAAQGELETALESVVLEGGGLGDIMALTKEMGPAIAKQTAIPSALAGLVGTAIGAFVINMLNKHDDHENQFGPAS